VSRLVAAARKQGFDRSPRRTMRAGARRALTFLGKKPTGEDVRHQELVGKLERLTQEIALLRSSQPPARA